MKHIREMDFIMQIFKIGDYYEHEAISIVYCRDCRHYDEETYDCRLRRSSIRWTKDDFCSYGVRGEK